MFVRKAIPGYILSLTGEAHDPALHEDHLSEGQVHRGLIEIFDFG